MADYVRAGTCGACKEFEFEGSGKKGYCRYYRAYYLDSDSCRHYEEDDGRLSSGGGCFLTTACCQYKGLSDDCSELTTLRSFRDNHLLQSNEGRDLVEEYYRIAPKLIEKIEQRPNAGDIYEQIFATIRQIVDQINQEAYASATDCYKDMVYTLQGKLS